MQQLFKRGACIVCLLFTVNTAISPVLANPEILPLYQKNCAECHGLDRLGGIGPALLPENLKRVRPKQATISIGEGLPATQMPAQAIPQSNRAIINKG